jgi:hypothetical protein
MDHWILDNLGEEGEEKCWILNGEEEEEVSGQKSLGKNMKKRSFLRSTIL